MKTSTKIIISITALLVVLVAIFFAAPYTDYKEAKEKGHLPTKYLEASTTGVRGPNWRFYNYFEYTAYWWATKFKGKTIDGGELPEITVTATKS